MPNLTLEFARQLLQNAQLNQLIQQFRQEFTSEEGFCL